MHQKVRVFKQKNELVWTALTNTFSGPFYTRFKVQYYEKNVNSDGKTKVGEGEVLFIAPRHPDKGVKTSQYVTWEDALRDIDLDLEARFWGAGPELSAEEVDRLTFGCCESCHGNTCRGCSEAMCGTFPQHSTNNQFFTPTMFSAYHREGYRASMEAKVEEFLFRGILCLRNSSSQDKRRGAGAKYLPLLRTLHRH